MDPRLQRAAARAQAPLGSFTRMGLVRSGPTCGGQPRTSFTSGVGVYEWIDQWLNGARNETHANIAATMSSDLKTLQLTCP